jgi:hypothetical protein
MSRCADQLTDWEKCYFLSNDCAFRNIAKSEKHVVEGKGKGRVKGNEKDIEALATCIGAAEKRN